MAVGVQYILDDQLHSRVIATIKADSKTNDLTSDLVENVLREYNIWHKRIIFVTDNALVGAFDEERVISCASHNANLVQKHCFDLSNSEQFELRMTKKKELIKQIKSYQSTVEACNSLVK